MGSGIAPKNFPPTTPFGKSPNSVVTPSQPVPYIGPDQASPNPALSGFQQSPANPAQPDGSDPTQQNGGGGSDSGGSGPLQDIFQQRMLSGKYKTAMPFFG